MKDVNGRIEKDHFMKKRHQILNSNLGMTSSSKRCLPAASQEIGFVHARRDAERHQLEKLVDRNDSSSPTPCGNQYSSHVNARKSTSIPESKLLEIIDLNERKFLLSRKMT